MKDWKRLQNAASTLLCCVAIAARQHLWVKPDWPDGNQSKIAGSL